MGYMQAFEQQLRERIAALESAGPDQVDAFVKWVKEQLLASYKNGILTAKVTKADTEAERQTRKFAREQ